MILSYLKDRYRTVITRGPLSAQTDRLLPEFGRIYFHTSVKNAGGDLREPNEAEFKAAFPGARQRRQDRWEGP